MKSNYNGNSRKISKTIIEFRKKERIESTSMLSKIIEKVNFRQRIHPSTRVFQALRILVNNEISELIKEINIFNTTPLLLTKTDNLNKGNLLVGTIDTWLIWNFTKGSEHSTDVTNASRTMLFNIYTQSWDSELLSLFKIPKSVLPTVHDCVHDFGVSKKEFFSRSIPVLGIAGDQHAALAGQSCFDPGMMKSTFGTGCFMMLNTGRKPVRSKNKLLTTVAYRLDGQISYGLEGSIFVAGAAVQWLRDKVHLISSAEKTETMARRASPDHGLYLIPAFTGLGAPYWDPNVRGALLGKTTDTSDEDIVRATLESDSLQ